MYAQVLPRYFNTNIYQSFRRTLTQYDFVCDAPSSYRHPLFARGRLDLLGGLVSKPQHQRKPFRGDSKTAPVNLALTSARLRARHAAFAASSFNSAHADAGEDDQDDEEGGVAEKEGGDSGAGGRDAAGEAQRSSSKRSRELSSKALEREEEKALKRSPPPPGYYYKTTAAGLLHKKHAAAAGSKAGGAEANARLPDDGRTKPLRPCPLCGKECSGGAALANHIKTHEREDAANGVASAIALMAAKVAAKVVAKYVAKTAAAQWAESAAEAARPTDAAAPMAATAPRLPAGPLEKPPKKQVRPCALCGKEFLGNVALVNHLERKHGGALPFASAAAAEEGGAPPPPAATAAAAGLGYTAKALLACGLCGKECVGGAALANHVKTHGRKTHGAPRTKAALKAASRPNPPTHPKYCDGLACACQHSRVTVSPIWVRQGAPSLFS